MDEEEFQARFSELVTHAASLTNLVAEQQAYILALYDCLKEQPSYNAMLFATRLDEYRERFGLPKTNLQDPNGVLQAMLRAFEGQSH